MASPVRGMYGTVHLHTLGQYKSWDGTKVGTVQKSGQYKSRDSIKVGTVHDFVYCTAPVIAKIIVMCKLPYIKICHVPYRAESCPVGFQVAGRSPP